LNCDRSEERKTQEALVRYWWLVVLRGVAAIIFGVLALVWPDVTLFVLVIMFGAYAFVDGRCGAVAQTVGGWPAALGVDVGTDRPWDHAWA
jgi:uncharacterized membrane protein HdeD (DUF308 family)